MFEVRFVGQQARIVGIDRELSHDQLVRGEEPWLDPYAAEDPAEFFAVCAEMFFDVPRRFRAEYPDVYEQLKRYFKLDLA